MKKASPKTLWPQRRLKYVSNVNMGQSPDSDSVTEYRTDADLPFLQGNAEFGDLTPQPKNACASPPKKADAGDILFSVRAPVGSMNIADRDYGVGRGLCAIKTTHITSRFAWWSLHYYRDRLMEVATGSTYEAVTAEDVRNLSILVPELSVQRRIADYLDAETAEIDALIAEKERMLVLLEEKRAALVTHAVTRGLDLTVKLKPSGLDWLGDVPAHWRVERLKFQLCRLEQGWSPQCDNYPANPDEWGILKVGAVNAWEFDPSENKRLPDDLEPLIEYQVFPRDVLMSRANTTELLGSIVFVRDVPGKLIFCDKHYRLDIDESVWDREFAVAFLRSSSGRFLFEREATGASNSMQNIGQDTVRNSRIVIPPLSEQFEIVDYLERCRKKSEAMQSNLRESIALLRERRSALITAAVTGQIPLEEMAA